MEATVNVSLDLVGGNGGGAAIKRKYFFYCFIAPKKK